MESFSDSQLRGLLGLPAELREHIYSYAFACTDRHAYCVWKELLLTLVDGRIYKVSTHRPYNSGRSTECGSAALALLRTCRMIHREALPIFHGNLEPRLHIDGRYRSPTEIKGLDLGLVDDVSFIRGVRIWGINVRLQNFEDAEPLVAQLQSLKTNLDSQRQVEWRRISVQISRYADDENPQGGRDVIEAVKSLSGIEAFEEIQDPWREGTIVFDYQAATE